MTRKAFKVGQKLRKNWDDSIVTIKRVNEDSIVLDGDFEPNHLIMKDKVKHYYSDNLNTFDEHGKVEGQIVRRWKL